MTIRCGYEIDNCLTGEDSYRQKKQFKTVTITHNKNVNTHITVAGVDIPLRIRKRTFTLESHQGWDYTDFVIIVDIQDYPVDCHENKSLYSLSVHENAQFTDGTIFILDTENKNAFWKETNYSCIFSGSSTDLTAFRLFSWLASKLRINTVNYEITTTWKLMINGIVETLYEDHFTKSMYSPTHPLFFVYPQPSRGISTDPDFSEEARYPNGEVGHGFSFLDYRLGAGGAETVPEIVNSGGDNYYYPEYLWYMGDYREEDQADAVQRFWDTFGVYTSVNATEYRERPFPFIRGPADPRGSIIRDFAGNTFASVTVTKQNGDLLHFNRLVSSDGTSIAIPETIPGSDIRYYPVGLI